MSKEELELLGNKAMLWKKLHPDVVGNGICRICPHLHDFDWCRRNPRLVYNKETRIIKIETGYLSNLGHGWCCIEWVKHV